MTESISTPAPLKPALTYEEQLTRLKDEHNLLIDDDDKAIGILKQVNYYRLSGYGLGLTKPDDKEKYVEGITLEHIFRLYQFDSALRNLLIHVIEHIEIRLRAQLSNHLALKYGSEGYTDPHNFRAQKNKNGTFVHDIILDNFAKECEHQKNAPFVKHHMNKYGGHFPLWVAVELFTFGNLSSLYSIMLKEDQKAVAALYDTEAQYLGSWILALVEVRNICAHYSRLYNMPLKQTPFLYSEYKKYRGGSPNKLFPVLLVIKRMLMNNEPWGSFETKLEALMEEYDDVVVLPYIEFPPEWKEVLSN